MPNSPIARPIARPVDLPSQTVAGGPRGRLARVQVRKLGGIARSAYREAVEGGQGTQGARRGGSVAGHRAGAGTDRKASPAPPVRSDMREAKTDAGHEGTWLCGCCVRSLWGATCALTEPEHQLERLGLPAQRQPGPNASDTSSTSPQLVHGTNPQGSLDPNLGIPFTSF